MTITVISERPNRTGDSALDGEGAERRIFIVQTTDRDVAAADLFKVAGLPVKGDAHPKDGSKRCKRLSYSQLPKSPDYLEVTYEYERMTSEEVNEEKEKDTTSGRPGVEVSDTNSPVNQRPEISWGGTPYDRVCSSQSGTPNQQPLPSAGAERGRIKGKGIVNSAGEPYDPPPTIDDAFPTCHVRRAERVARKILLLDYIGAVNLDTYTIDGERVAPFTSRVLDIRIGRLEYDDFNHPFHWVEYDIGIKDDDNSEDKDWVMRLLDFGSYYYDTSEQIKPFMDDLGNPILGFLNGAGFKRDDADPEHYYNAFHVRKERIFDKLNLPVISW